MFVFATAEPYGSYHLEPLAQRFADNSVHLMPATDTDPNTSPAVPVTRDASVLQSAAALIITGGSLNEWTEGCALTAAHHGIPVYYLELAYAHAAPYEHSTSWLTHAFCGSEYSQGQLVSHLQVDPAQITVIGYPHLDGISTRGNEHVSSATPRVLILGTIESPAWDRMNTAVAHAFRDLGCQVVERHHPRANPTPQPSLEEQLSQVDLVVGAPGTAYLAAAAMGIPLWRPEHSSIPLTEPIRHLAQLAHPVPVSDLGSLSAELATALTNYSPLNPDIVGHYLGPQDQQAVQRLWMHLLLDDIINT